jgi:hypothetical protein
VLERVRHVSSRGVIVDHVEDANRAMVCHFYREAGSNVAVALRFRRGARVGLLASRLFASFTAILPV